MINSAIIYDLHAENRREVALLDDIDSWTDPVKFSATGYDYITKHRQLVANLSETLGFENSLRTEELRGLVRSYSEIDLRQIKFISDRIVRR